MPNVSKAEFARNLGVSKPRVTQYIAHGLPVLASGKIDLDVATRWVADNFRASDRNEGKGADRAGKIVKAKTAKARSPERIASVPFGIPLEDALASLLKAVGPIAARMAVTAGAPMRMAYALEAMVPLELEKVAFRQFAASKRTELHDEEWPWIPMEPGHHKAMDAFWRELAAQAGEPLDEDAWDEFMNGLPWPSDPGH